MEEPIVMSDWIAVILHVITIILAIMVFVAGINAGSVFVAIFIPMLILILGRIIAESFVSDEMKQKMKKEEQRKQYNKMHGGYRCPNCGAMAGHPIGTLSKKWSIEIMGAASDKFGKTYKCEKCGYMW